MSVLKSPSFFLAVTAATTLCLSTLAQAQVRINLTTAQQTSCVVLTDANGVQLVSGSTDLAAGGVTLTGAGCQSGSGSSANFGATVSVPATVVAPGAVNVTWSASSDAKRCVYGGSDVAGWPSGSLACQDSSCADQSPHVTPVTISSAGNYTFSMVCTNASGYASGGLTATGSSGGVPTPANFPLVAPASGTTGVPFTVSWSVNGATSCSGSASLNGSSTSLPGWTNTTSATSPRSPLAAAPGAYTLQLTCSNTAGSVTSQFATVLVAQGDASCPTSPLTRQVIGSIQYPPILPGSPTRQNVDLTQYDNIYGHNTASDPLVPWPGFTGASPVITAFGRNNYIAAKFHTTSTLSPTFQGNFKNISNYGGTTIDTAISGTCGDFAPAQAGCVRLAVDPSDSGTVYYRAAAGTPAFCHLEPNTDYYLNIRMTDPAAGNVNCAATNPTCRLHTNNTHN